MESLSINKLKKVATELNIKNVDSKGKKSLIDSINRNKNKDSVIIDLCSSFKTEVFSLPENGSVKSLKGEREYMEDTHVVAQKGLIKFYGVFDGHSGKQVSNYLKRHLPRKLLSEVCKSDLSTKSVIDTINRVYKEIDLDIMKKKFKGDPGSTAIVALIVRDKCFLINVGDSRGLLISNGKILYRTKDHKPNLKEEKERVLKYGGKVTYDDVPRVSYPLSNKELAMSRAFGDIDYKINKNGTYLYDKAPVIVIPSIKIKRLEPNVKYTLVLGSDGVWDVMSNKVVLDTTKTMGHNKAVEVISKKSLGSGDNVTVLISHFKISKASAQPRPKLKTQAKSKPKPKPKPKSKSPKK